MTDYEYRYAAVRGLERRKKPIETHKGIHNLNSGYRYAVEPTEPAWLKVTGDDFLAMDWRELRYVSEIIGYAIWKPKLGYWKSIESAPMDGTLILVSAGDEPGVSVGVDLVYYEDGEWLTPGAHGYDDLSEMKYWMRCPEQPHPPPDS